MEWSEFRATYLRIAYPDRHPTEIKKSGLYGRIRRVDRLFREDIAHALFPAEDSFAGAQRAERSFFDALARAVSQVRKD